MSTNSTTIATIPEGLKHRIKVGVEPTPGTEDASLPGPIGDPKGIGARRLPLDVTSLVEVNKDHESDKNNINFPTDEVFKHD